MISPEEKSAKAESLFLEGYNCAQSVFAAFVEETGLELRTALRIASGFGGGIGGLRQVCGAFTGACMAAGMVLGYHESDDMDGKRALYTLEKVLAARFSEAFGTLQCRELMEKNSVYVSAEPSERTPEYYRTRPCARYVGFMAGVLAEELNRMM